MKLEEFAQEVLEDVLALAEATPDGEFQENVFTRTVLDWLVEIGECIDPEVCFYKASGMKANGWDMHEENDSMDLFVTIFDGTNATRKLTRSEVLDAFARGRKFLARCLKGLWKDLEESATAFQAAQEISHVDSRLRNVRLYLLTNGWVRPEPVPDERLDQVVVAHHVWDIERLFQVYGGGGAPEAIDVTEQLLDGGIPCARMDSSNGVYDAYVGIIPGAALASLYERWGQRLLERNLRSFLQVRGSVNKEIQKTLLEHPEMFLAYNNGISTTAESAEIVDRDEDGRYLIRRLKNLQIVNGAQTTASIYEAARRKGADLGKVFVPIKITVLRDPSLVDQHVPLISRYANSQNKVNVSDFSSNHPYHIGLERLSRKIWVPNPDARGKSTSKWYYERARGGYLTDLHQEETPTKRAAFRIQYPPVQKLTKPLIAKYEMTWMQYPHVVSLGAEKNFKQFMSMLEERGPFLPDEAYFRRLVAKAILFRRCDDLVRKAQYPGYKANIVTYSISYLSFRTAQLLDLDWIWEHQDISPATSEALSRIAVGVQAHITRPPREGMNVGEWCKREQCWTSLRDSPMELPDLKADMIEVGRRSSSPLTVNQGTNEPTPEESEMILQAAAVDAGTWFKLAAWGKQTGNLEIWERKFTFSIGRLISRGRPPSKRQAPIALRILKKARGKGFVVETKKS